MTKTAAPQPASTDGGRVLRVALAAGGTGGHLMPALAAADALQRLTACEFLVLGSPRASERDLRGMIPYPAVEIRAAALAGGGLGGKLRGLLRLPGAVLAAMRHLRRFRADLVIATGGYVCGPSGFAAWLLRIPLLVLEQNATPGMTTRMLTPFAAAVGVSFAATAERLGRKAVLTGNPVRATLPAAPRRDGMPMPPPASLGVHVLILGGSQGARGLNTMVQLALPQLAAAEVGLTFTHQTGKQDVETMRQAYATNGFPATVTPFINSIGEAYARADLVCSRAGATTVAELTFCGLPSILVPYPHAAGLHQHDNARALAAADAAVIVEEGTDGTPLATAILELAGDRQRRGRMAAAAAACGSDDAAGAVAHLALSLLNGATAHHDSDVGFAVGSRPSETG